MPEKTSWCGEDARLVSSLWASVWTSEQESFCSITSELVLTTLSITSSNTRDPTIPIQDTIIERKNIPMSFFRCTFSREKKLSSALGIKLPR